jgi:ATP-binding cassette subfamily B protein
MASRGTQSEARLGSTRDIELVRQLWKYIHPYRRLFALSMALLPAVSACMLAQPYIVKRAIDDYISRGTVDGLGTWALAFGVVIIGEFFCLYWQHYVTMLVAQKSLADLRVEVFRKVQTLESQFFDRNPVGRLVTRMTTDIDVINEMFAAGAITILMDGITLFGIIAIMFAIDAQLALVALSTLPILAFVIDFFRRKARRYYRLIRERVAKINAYLQEAITGMAIVQLFAREDQMSEEFDRLNSLHRDAYHRSNLYEASLFSIVETVSNISIALIIWFGAHLILQAPVATNGLVAEVIGFGTLVAFIEYMNKFFIPIRDFSTKYTVMQSAITACERVFDLLKREPDIANPETPAATPPPAGVIEFDDVTFAYIEGEPILKGISFRVEAGEHVAIVGTTGSGKTTVTKLLARFYEIQSGSIRVDGVDVREWNLPALRRRIGMVQQDVYLFSGTVSENVRLWEPTIDDATVRGAAERVNADRFINRLAAKYNEPVRERGNNFSTGQRQLLSFARALAFEPEILVLDEATSSVDTETEELIQDAVAKLQNDRTSLVIAHRLSTIENADRIIVMHHGDVREQGNHAQLMAIDGLYARLYRLQHEASTLDLRGDGASDAEGTAA